MDMAQGTHVAAAGSSSVCWWHLQIIIANSRIIKVALRDAQLLDVPREPVDGAVVPLEDGDNGPGLLKNRLLTLLPIAKQSIRPDRRSATDRSLVRMAYIEDIGHDIAGSEGCKCWRS